MPYGLAAKWIVTKAAQKFNETVSSGDTAVVSTNPTHKVVHEKFQFLRWRVGRGGGGGVVFWVRLEMNSMTKVQFSLRNVENRLGSPFIAFSFFLKVCNLSLLTIGGSRREWTKDACQFHFM